MPPNGIIYENEVFVDVDVDVPEGSPDSEVESDFETAISYAGIGKFQYLLLGVSGAIYATCAVSSTTLSFVLPSAECDFNLTSADKGKLSAVPLFGMLCGCSLWGPVANSRGRRMAIIVSLSMDFVAAFVSSFVHDYRLFMVCRFFNGFGIIGATSLVFSYLGEFLSVKHRDKYLGKLEIFWNIGVILLPVIAWCFLDKKALEVFGNGGEFSPWRIFVLICSFPSLLSVILIYFLPETPKFLISKRKFDEAREVFRKIYCMNTSESVEKFPVHRLEGEENNNCLNVLRKDKPARNGFMQSCALIRDLVHQQYFKYLTLTCLVDFGLMASYYTLILWFPEIFDRFSQFSKQHPGESAGVCEVSQEHPVFNSTLKIECNPAIASNVFLDTIIIGLSCIPTSASLSYFMYKIGKKAVLVSSLVLSGLCTLSLNWVATQGQTLALSCVFEALTSILEAVLFCVVVDLFPTNLRAVALTTTATCGRLGAIFGNVIFGALIDINCAVPIYLFGALLIVSGGLCLAVPKNENYITIQ